MELIRENADDDHLENLGDKEASQHVQVPLNGSKGIQWCTRGTRAVQTGTIWSWQ